MSGYDSSKYIRKLTEKEVEQDFEEWWNSRHPEGYRGSSDDSKIAWIAAWNFYINQKK